MSALAQRAGRSRFGSPTALTALAAAVLGYLAHHASPLAGHAAETAASAVILATAIAVGLAAAAATRRPIALPDVVVATPGTASSRLAERSDLDFCGALHARTLGHGFFVALGPRFLRAYHATFVDSPHAIALIASLDDHPVGALDGVLDPGAHRRWTLRHRGTRLVAGGLLALVTRPVPAVRVLRTRIARYGVSWWRYRRDGAAAGRREDDERTAVLSHVAVLPGARGTGVGGRLVGAFVEAARRSEVDRVTLVTLEGDEGAGEFYARLRWRPGPVHVTDEGRGMREWDLAVRRGEGVS